MLGLGLTSSCGCCCRIRLVRTQFSILATKLLAMQKQSDRVDYNTFNLNIQTLNSLDFLGQK